MGMSFNQILNRFVWNGLGLAVLAAPLALGSVHWPAWMSLAVLSGALLVSYVLLLFRRGFRVRFDGVVLLMLAAMAVMLFQLVPLGESLLSALSPTAAATVEKSRELGFEIPTRISLDPAETVRMLCFVGTLLCLYVVAFNLAYREAVGNKLLALVGAAGGLVAMVTVLHSVSGTQLILGVYEPARGMPEGILFFSSFVNNNNAAGLLNLATLVLVGQWHKAQFGKTKGIFTFLVLLTGAASIAMLSRGGFLALLLGAGFMVVLTRWSLGPRRGSNEALIGGLGLVLTIACAALFMVLFDLVIGKTEGHSLLPFSDEASKMDLWPKVVPLIREFKLAGAGAGAFSAAFTPHNDFQPFSTFLSAENEILEPLLEFGIPAGALLLGGVAFLFWRRAGLARRDAYYTGAFAGLVALGIQSVADFGLRITGVAIPAAVAFAALSGAYAKEAARQRSWSLIIEPSRLLPVAVVAFFLLLFGGMWVRDSNAEASYGRVQAAIGAGSSGQEAPLLGASEVALHPRDSYLFSRLGEAARKLGDAQRAEKLYERAGELCPACVAPQIGMVKLYLEKGEQVPALETLLDVARKKSGGFAVFRAVLQSGIPARTIVEVWGQDPDTLFDLIKYSYGSGDSNALPRTETLLQESLNHRGYEMKFLDLLGQIYLSVKRPDKADLIATYLMGLYPEEKYGYQIQARIFVMDGRLEEALLMYEEARKRGGEEDVALALETMGLLAGTRSWDRFEAMAAELRPVVGQENKYKSHYHSLMATREEMRGNFFAALGELDQAESSSPFNIGIALKKAELQLKLGRADKAAAEYRKALKIDPRSSVAAEGLRNLETHRSPQEGLL